MIEIDFLPDDESEINEYSVDSFTQLDADTNYSTFFQCFMAANKPCIFNSSLTANWNARSSWVMKNGTPNVDFFRSEYGMSSEVVN